MNNNNANSTNKALQAQIVAQWITSLAISVVCCAVLFIVFAGYIVELHDTTNLLTVKLEVLQERHNQLNSEITLMKRPTVVQINNESATKQVVPASEPQTPAASPAPAAGGEIPAPAIEVPGKDELMPVMNETEPQEQLLAKPTPNKDAAPKKPEPKKPN